uniref:Uncharacterized protein n=1 Tax=Alexandrium andersonii TaxID=327968 RepID=A0A7S2IG14_9DINO|mmetsp:Transcript_83028/g.185355  ORF Transcript_83028/g.185355 Transcript_83028/m.185355 type:complete len:181 (+) Transcript_83028:69-611(+)
MRPGRALQVAAALPLCCLAVAVAAAASAGKAECTACTQSRGTSLLLVHQEFARKSVYQSSLQEVEEEFMGELASERSAKAALQPSGPAGSEGASAQSMLRAWRLRLLGVASDGEFPTGPWAVVGLVSIGIFSGLLLYMMWQCCCTKRKSLDLEEDLDDEQHEAWIRSNSGNAPGARSRES